MVKESITWKNIITVIASLVIMHESMKTPILPTWGFGKTLVKSQNNTATARDASLSQNVT